MQKKLFKSTPERLAVGQLIQDERLTLEILRLWNIGWSTMSVQSVLPELAVTWSWGSVTSRQPLSSEERWDCSGLFQDPQES